MRFLTLSKKLSLFIEKTFDQFVSNAVGVGLNKSSSNMVSILEKSFKRGIKSQFEGFRGIYTRDEFITLDLLRSYNQSALVKSKAEFIHKANTLIFKDKSTTENKFSSEETLMKCFHQMMEEEKTPFSRIISTMINDAYQEGRCAGIKRSFSGSDPYVYKRPRKNACLFCKSLYLKKDEVTPTVFRLSEMIEAGINNDGRHHHRPDNTAWKAVVGSVHPWCRCELNSLNKGYSFDDEGNVVVYKSKTFYW